MIAIANSNLLEFTFYTDGSVINLGNSQCSMGIAWIQVFKDQIIHQFSAQIQNWPSSYKAELVAILLAICTCPRNSTIHIYTDSQSIISKYKSLLYSIYNPNKIYSYNYWPIWHTLFNLIQSYSYTIIFHKVLAHSDNKLNNYANKLAKEHTNSSLLEFLPNNIYNPSFFLQYKQFNVEQPTLCCIKNICNAHIITMWSLQNRIQHIISIATQIDWNATWLFLNNNHKSSYNYTNFQLCQSKSF